MKRTIKSVNDIVMEDYLIFPDKYVYPFMIKEKTKERQIITYNAGMDYGASLRKAHTELADEFYLNFCDRNAHSFAYHKNVRTLDALEDHLKSTHFIKIDIHHFFESITEEKFFEIYGDRFNSRWKKRLSACFYKESLSIGYVTSPMISDYFMSKFDDSIEEYISKNRKLHYSRYCDDMLISSEEENTDALNTLFDFIKEELDKLKLTINDKKTQKITLDYDGHNSLTFLGLAISRLNENTNKITISKRYILFLLKLIAKNNRYGDSCKELLDEINSRVGYLYYNSTISYERFQKKHMNLYGKRYNFIPKKPVDRKVSDFAKEIPDWDKYLAIFKLKLHGKAVDTSSGAITSNDSVILEEYIGKEKEIDIPEFIDAIGDGAFENSKVEKVHLSRRIKSIGDRAFSNSKIKEINLPEKLRSIGKQAFAYTENLKTITIPGKIKRIAERLFFESKIEEVVLNEGLIEIEKMAFYDSKIKKITIPNTVTKIGDSCFDSCSYLKEVVLSDSLTVLPKGTFNGCASLREINFPESILSLDAYCFGGCYNLSNISITKNIVNIAGTVFNGCYNLKTIKVDENNPVYDSRENSNAIIETSTNRIIVVLNDGFIPDSVEIIGPGLYFNSLIKEIVLPKNVKKIAVNAFLNCKLLKKVTLLSDTFEHISKSAFENCISLEEINIPEGITKLGKSAFENCYRLKKINLPDSIETIDDSCFKGVSSVEFTIPSSIKSIGKKAFAKCYGIKELNIPSTLKNIGAHAFSGISKSLNRITVDPLNPIYSSRNNCNCLIENKTNTILLGCCNSIIEEGITAINDYAFEGTNGFSSLNIPKTVERIGDFAFCGCESLKTLSFEKIYSIGKNAFSNCVSLKVVNIPDSCDTLGDSCFSGCISLDEIVLPNSITNFGHSTFKNCRSLKKITFPSSYVDKYDSSLFEGCENLEKISVSSENEYYKVIDNCLINTKDDEIVLGCNVERLPDVKRIGSLAFNGINHLDKVIIPSSVSAIGDYAFYKSGIRELVFEANEKQVNICDFAFAGCINLEKIDFAGNKYYFYNSVFDSCLSLKGIELSSKFMMGRGCFANCKSLEKVVLNDADKISPSTFTNTNIKTIDLSNIDEIGHFAFMNCKSLEEVLLRKTPKEKNYGDININIGFSSFENCENLTKIPLDDVYTIDTRAFKGCRKLKEVSLFLFQREYNGSSLGVEAFEGCESLEKVELNSISTIGDKCFEDCGLESISFTDKQTEVGSFAFKNNRRIRSVIIGKNVKKLGENPFAYCESLTDLSVVPSNGVYKSINNYVYYVDKSLSLNGACAKTLAFGCNGTGDIEEDIKKVSESAFLGCGLIKEVKLSDQCAIIGEYAFKDCKSLSSFHIPESLKMIQSGTFDGSGIESIFIPAKVLKIADDAFLNTKKLNRIECDFDNDTYVTNVNGNLLMTKSGKLVKGLSNVKVIPSKITVIEKNAFNGTDVEEIELPDSVTKLDLDAFSNTRLKKISFGSNIGYCNDVQYAFRNCPNLEEMSVSYDNPFIYVSNGNLMSTGVKSVVLFNKFVNLDNTVRSIKEFAFYPFERIDSLNIPESVFEISTSLLKGKDVSKITVDKENPIYDSRDDSNSIIETLSNKLIVGCKNTVIPESVFVIGANAFDNTIGLKKITLPKNVRSVNYDSFINLNDLEEIEVDKENKSYTSLSSNLIAATKANRVFCTCKNSVIPKTVFSKGCLSHADTEKEIKQQQSARGVYQAPITDSDSELPF